MHSILFIDVIIKRSSLRYIYNKTEHSITDWIKYYLPHLNKGDVEYAMWECMKMIQIKESSVAIYIYKLNQRRNTKSYTTGTL